MSEDVRGEILREFRRIPGVGPRIAEDLWDLGLRSVEELKGRDAELLRWWNWHDRKMAQR